jgi:hypothetical protein
MAISRRKKDLPKWRYAFNCKDCLHIQTINDGVREGDYCMRSVVLEHSPIHADDDRVVRCDEYVSCKEGCNERIENETHRPGPVTA